VVLWSPVVGVADVADGVVNPVGSALSGAPLVHRLPEVEEGTILLTTHDLADVESLADRILILAAGHIVADGSADELARQVEDKAQIRWRRDRQMFAERGRRCGRPRPTVARPT
jgi:ABC-type glutathione transport system ATPase component